MRDMTLVEKYVSFKPKSARGKVAQFHAESVAHFTAERVVHLPQNTHFGI
jgi:hypothetical protein